MAHIGKFYEVAFRRDFNLDVGNNNKGFAKAYSFGTQDIFGSIGELLPGKIFNLEAADQKTFNGIHWKSQTITLDGYHVYVEMVTTDDPATKGVQTTGGIYTTEVGVLSTFKAGPPGGAGYGQLTGHWIERFPPWPGLFLASFSATWTAGAVRW